MHRGYIKSWRKMVEWEWFTDVPVCHLFNYLKLVATHKETSVRGQPVKRGQYLTSYRNLARDTGLSFQQVRTALKKLSKTGEISTQVATQGYSLITINNYSIYQDEKEASNTDVNKRATQQQHKNKNVKNVKNKEEEHIVGLKPNGKVPYAEIISFLNEKTNRDFRHDTKKTQRLIKARWNERFTLEDFKTVISHRTKQWLFDDEMHQYLRPDTLFGTKFEGYLQAAKTEDKPKSRWVFDNNGGEA